MNGNPYHPENCIYTCLQRACRPSDMYGVTAGEAQRARLCGLITAYDHNGHCYVRLSVYDSLDSFLITGTSKIHMDDPAACDPSITGGVL